MLLRMAPRPFIHIKALIGGHKELTTAGLRRERTIQVGTALHGSIRVVNKRSTPQEGRSTG